MPLKTQPAESEEVSVRGAGWADDSGAVWGVGAPNLLCQVPHDIVVRYIPSPLALACPVDPVCAFLDLLAREFGSLDPATDAVCALDDQKRYASLVKHSCSGDSRHTRTKDEYVGLLVSIGWLALEGNGRNALGSR